jgi:signal transduction histidine kinase
VHPADAARLRADLMACVEGAATGFENEHRMLHRDASIRWFLARGSAILLPDGRAGGVIGTIIDITERKLAEARLHEMQDELARVSKLTALGEYAASIAHEISQPLSGILMNSTAALRCLEGPVRQKQHQIRVALQEIVHDGERARELMRRNRELFQHHTVEKALLDVNSVVRAVAEIARVKLQRSRVTVQYTLSEGLPAVLGDRLELQQVLLNLVLNGIDAMEGVESPSRQLRIDTCLTDGNMVRITVRDKGLGLEDVDAERIFKPLYTTKPTGTGVGLFICRSIVEVHGGKVWVERNDGPGAAFCFTIPAAGTGTPARAPATPAGVAVGD